MGPQWSRQHLQASKGLETESWRVSSHTFYSLSSSQVFHLQNVANDTTLTGWSCTLDDTWPLRIQCFGFLFWYNADHSKGFYSPCLKNKPCSTGQRTNIEILLVVHVL